MNKINTPWGSISTDVSILPIYYLIFMYGFVYILPFGEYFIGLSWFDWFRSEDGLNRGEGPLEWIQFFEYALSSLISFFVYFKIKNKRSTNSLIWLIIGASCFFIAAEEISWGERIFNYSIESLTELSIQGETNLHNLPFFHNYILDPALQIICIFLGWVGWRKWPYLTSLPSKKFSLFFLIVALYFFYYEVSWFSTVKHIRNDQEIFELLLSTGIFLHCWESVKSLFKTEYKK
mgnify:CR=1 FL=1|tara:strand:- start:1429 stop:2130 length:702 start_codon:yes stop_codon:yes gene_type:complete